MGKKIFLIYAENFCLSKPIKDLMFVIFQYKDAFMKANPDYKWHNPDKSPPNQKSVTPKPTNVLRNEIDLLAEGSIMPGKLAGKKDLTHKAPPVICSRRQFKNLLLFQKIQIRHDISLELSASHEISYLIFVQN